MLKDVKLGKGSLIQVKGEIKILLRFSYLDCFKIFLLACINGLYCLTMFHLVWHNLAVNLIAFLIGSLETPFMILIIASKITKKHTDKFY